MQARRFSTVSRLGCLGSALLLYSGTQAWADFIELKDGNYVEVKIVGQEMKEGKVRGKLVPFWKCEDEKGVVKLYEATEIVNKWQMQTSWEKRAENQKWYQQTAPKTENTWQAQAQLATSCSSRELFDDALVHFKKAFDLRLALPLEPGQS